MRYVWLDDLRLPPDGYDVWCTTYEDMIRFLDAHWGRIAAISLDHDLGDDGYGTGYDVMKFIEEKVCRFSYELSFDIHIHSDNPVGRKNMQAAVEAIHRFLSRPLDS